jgi:CubicO group peptidase (beta-lactamase class C family)
VVEGKASKATTTRTATLIEEGAKVPWPRATPEDAGLNGDALAKLVEDAERTGSDALLLIRDDRVVVARSFGHPQEPLELMSVTKGFVGLAIGFLLEEGKIPSLDAPMSTWFPEWRSDKKDGRKSRVTLRHVLTHTSGLAHKPAAGELTKQRDRVAYVRALPIETEPGAVFSYNNEAIQLLSVVVASAAHEPIDSYLKKKLFDPLGIERFTWDRDASGNRATAWGLSLSAVDLAKVGLMLRADGVYQGKQVVPASWVVQMQTPAKNASWHGLLTWLLYDGPWQVQTPELRAKLATEGFTAVSKLAPLDGKKFSSRAGYWMEAGALLAPPEREALGALVRDDLLPIETAPGALVGWNFNGWLGQYLVVYPRAGVVAVRQRREPTDVTDEDNAKIGMKSFTSLVRAALP